VHRNKLLFVAVLALAEWGRAVPTRNPDPEVEPPSGPVARRPEATCASKVPSESTRLCGGAGATSGFGLSELGLYPAPRMVHNVALGGVDPYGPGLYESSGVTASYDSLGRRAGCVGCLYPARGRPTWQTPATALIFRGVPLAGKKLASPDGPEVRGVIGLADPASTVAQSPIAMRVERYVRLATDIEATGNAEPARAWMQSVCFAILTSTESVFY
jgi:hypothetical protein